LAHWKAGITDEENGKFIEGMYGTPYIPRGPQDKIKEIE
tara:strand:+ start:890 stop:1006 length:117 start_codon:yes stop_codon:yes gene_type:complete